MADNTKSARWTIMQTYNNLGQVGKYSHGQICTIIGKQMSKAPSDIETIVNRCKKDSIKFPSMEEYMKTIEKPTKDEGDSFMNLLKDIPNH